MGRRAQGTWQEAWNLIVSPPGTGGVSLATASEGVVDNKAIKTVKLHFNSVRSVVKGFYHRVTLSNLQSYTVVFKSKQ